MRLGLFGSNTSSQQHKTNKIYFESKKKVNDTARFISYHQMIVVGLPQPAQAQANQ